MITTFIGIESICIQHKQFVTIACNVMIKGKLYDEPQYTNLFASYEELIYLLRNENNSTSKQVETDLNFMLANKDELDTIQIDLPDYIENSVDWKLTTMYELEIEEDEDIPFECYKFRNSQ